MALAGFVLNNERYVGLLEKLIGETEFLQDNPPKFVPQEDKWAPDIALLVYSAASAARLNVRNDAWWGINQSRYSVN